MSKKQVILVLSFLAASLSGCALTTDRIELGYSPQHGVSPIPAARGVSVNVQVTDQRLDKSKVSSKKNGFGMEMARIITTEDVAITVRRAIEKELQARGFELGPDVALVKIAADLTRFYNDHKMGFFAGDAVADLNLSVIVKSNRGEHVYSRQIVSQGMEKNTLLATGENARLALDRALEEGLKILFNDKAFLSALLASSKAKLTSN